MRIEEAGAAVRRPHRLETVFARPDLSRFGHGDVPFLLQKEKGAYMWQDMVRQCRKYGLRWTKPSAFPRLSVLPARVALLGVEEPWIGAFCRQVMELNFVDDEDINKADRLAPILTGA